MGKYRGQRTFPTYKALIFSSSFIVKSGNGVGEKELWIQLVQKSVEQGLASEGSSSESAVGGQHLLCHAEGTVTGVWVLGYWYFLAIPSQEIVPGRSGKPPGSPKASECIYFLICDRSIENFLASLLLFLKGDDEENKELLTEETRYCYVHGDGDNSSPGPHVPLTMQGEMGSLA